MRAFTDDPDCANTDSVDHATCEKDPGCTATSCNMHHDAARPANNSIVTLRSGESVTGELYNYWEANEADILDASQAANETITFFFSKAVQVGRVRLYRNSDNNWRERFPRQIVTTVGLNVSEQTFFCECDAEMATQLNFTCPGYGAATSFVDVNSTSATNSSTKLDFLACTSTKGSNATNSTSNVTNCTIASL